MTVGDLARSEDPEFDRHLQQHMANVGPQIQRSVQAINRALPDNDEERGGRAKGARSGLRKYARSNLSQALDAGGRTR